MQRPKRLKDEKYLAYIRTMACLVCGGVPSQAHHLMHGEPSATGKRSGDDWAVPLCQRCHRGLHEFGREPIYWLFQGIASIAWAERTYKEWKNRKGGKEKDGR